MVQTDWAQEECNLMIHKLIAHQLGSVSLKSSLVQNKKNLHRGKNRTPYVHELDASSRCDLCAYLKGTLGLHVNASC